MKKHLRMRKLNLELKQRRMLVVNGLMINLLRDRLIINFPPSSQATNRKFSLNKKGIEGVIWFPGPTSISKCFCIFIHVLWRSYV